MTSRGRIQRWKNLAPDWRVLLATALVVVSFPPWDFWPAIWISLVPFFSALHRTKTLRQSLLQGFWFGFFICMGAFYWVSYVLQEFANFPWYLSLLGLLLFACVSQIQWVIFSAISFWTRSFTQSRLTFLGTLNAVVLAFIFVGIDTLLPKLFVDTLGHCLYRAQALRQVADLGGAAALSFLIFFANDTIYAVYLEIRYHRKLRVWPQILVFALLLASAWKYGQYRLDEIRAIVAKSPRGIQTAAIQGNIGDFDKIAAENGIAAAAFKILDTFMDMTDQALKMTPKPEIVVWPETSFPSTFRTPHSTLEIQLDAKMEEYVKSRGIPVFFGGYDHHNDKDYNALFYLSPLGQLQVYRKNILLLFGEYIPGADLFPFIKKEFPQVGNFGRGEGPVHLTLELPNSNKGQVRVGPIICYEALFPEYLIESANRGSELIMNITNDSWFGRWGEPQLHLALTVFRSIETRLPQLRTTNTGISTLITADGEITHATPLNETRIMNVYIPLTEKIPTLIKLWGDWFGKFSLICGLIGLLILFWNSREKHFGENQ